MAQQIYQLWRARFTEAWYQLSHDEQRSLMAQVGEALTQVGGKSVVLCMSAWADEHWQGFGVEEYPDLAAVQQHSQRLMELNWYRYVESQSTLGTAWELPT